MDGVDAITYILENNIDGAIVECGVESGNFEYIWINELMKHNVVRDIYLYDTFAGLTEPSEYDYTCKSAKIFEANKDQVYNYWKSRQIDNNTNSWCYTPLETVHNRLISTGYPVDKLHYIVGDVLETLKIMENIPEKIAILRLDTDWYESSKFELEQMYNNVVDGGVIIFDDYYHWDGQRRAVDDFFSNLNITPYFVNIGNYKTAAFIKNKVMNQMFEIGIKCNTDKITYHNYHEIYELFLKNFYSNPGAMLEIGIDQGSSLSMWLELFPNAFIYGMDIGKQYNGTRYNIIQGDQSNIVDLNKVKDIISTNNIFFINDDGSHIPEHQLLTFNTLFPTLCEGGIYIIEDIEVSYWTKYGLYGYETKYGYKHKKSIIEIFKDVVDSINSEFAGKHHNDVMHHNKFGSITFSKNCIIIVKKTQIERPYRMPQIL